MEKQKTLFVMNKSGEMLSIKGVISVNRGSGLKQPGNAEIFHLPDDITTLVSLRYSYGKQLRIYQEVAIDGGSRGSLATITKYQRIPDQTE